MADERQTETESNGDQIPEPPAYELPFEPGDAGYDMAEQSGHYGIMYAGEYEWDNARCTAEAYGEYDESARPGNRRQTIDGKPRRSLKFHSTWMDVAEATDCVAKIGEYNRFDAFYVGAALDALPDGSKVVVGRESSPVVYVWTDAPLEAYDVLDGITKPCDTEDLPSWMNAPEDGEMPIGPDELGGIQNAETYPIRVVGDSKYELEAGVPTLIRGWWD